MSGARSDRPTRTARTGGPLRSRLPLTVWAITALWAAVLLGAGLVWPMAYGYDEPQHIDMAYVYSGAPFHFYDPAQLPPTRASVGVQTRQPGFPPRVAFLDAPIEPRGERPSFAQMGGRDFVVDGQPNQMMQHPPLYYWAMAVVLRVPGVDHLAWDVQVWLMRLVSSIFLLPLPALCWATMRRLLQVRRPVASGATPVGDEAARESRIEASAAGLTAAAVLLTIPNLARDGSAVTNDTLLVLAGSVLVWGLVRVMTGDLGLRVATWVSAALAVALLTKGFGLVFPPVILAAYLMAAGRRRTDGGVGRAMAALVRPLLVVAAGGAIGMTWWVRNLVLYKTLQVNGLGEATQLKVYGPLDGGGPISRFVPEFSSQFIMRIWGGIGLADTPSMGPVLTYGWFALVVVGILVACTARSRNGARGMSLVLTAAVLLTFVVVGAGSQATNSKWSFIIAGAQGRYVYHLVIVLAAVSVLGWVRVLRPAALPLLAPVVLIGGLVTTVTAWVFVIEQWYTPLKGSGPGTLVSGLHGLLRWSPLPSAPTLLLVVVLPAVTSIVALVVLVLDGRARAREVHDVEERLGLAPV
ncbi:MAG: hypothetical protein M3Y71_02065 [Actinomycetota bacterium]|nr:hypothetical protein [Actinomycetota bacterium]